jgi:hypothetical protein
MCYPPEHAENGTPMRTTRLLTAALLGALALAGCDTTLNTGSPASSDAPVVAAPVVTPTPTYVAPSTYAWQSACDLFLGVDGAALIDEPLGTPYVSKPTRCQMEGSTAHSTAALELYITSPGGAADFEYQKKLQGVDHDIAGLGDAAFQSADYVHVLVGDNEFALVSIRTLVDHPALTLDEQVAAARIILANTGW